MNSAGSPAPSASARWPAGRSCGRATMPARWQTTESPFRHTLAICRQFCAVAAAVSHVLALGNSGQPVLRLAFSLVARDGNGILVPSNLLRTPGLEPLLVRTGWQLVDTPELAVDVAVPMVNIVALSSDRSIATADRIRLRTVLIADDQIGDRRSRSALVSLLMASSPPSALPPQVHLDLAARLASELRIVPTSTTSPQSFAAALERLL